MSVDAVISELGYQGSPNFLTEKDFGRVSGYSHILRRALGRGCLKGVYTLKDGLPEGDAGVVPVVYVCEESPRTGPDEIHRLAWNQNVVPFVLVAAKDVVRLYSGFSYGPTNESQ